MKLVIAVTLTLLANALASVLTAGSRCSLEEPCPEPLSCVGNPHNLRCFQKKELGMTCGKDPFWVCVDGLTCIDNVCKQVADTAGRCGTPNTVCAEGLSCVGNPTNLKCFKKRELGMKCGKDPFWVCEDGLSCIDDVCKQVVDKAGGCGAPNTVCADGLSCVGNPTNLKCFKKKELGMSCGKDPFWVCEDSLSCIDEVCKQVVDTAGRCGTPNTVCAEGLSCVGNPTNLKCFKKRELGMKCGKDPFWVCEDGLSCIDDVCKQVIDKAGRCGAPNTACADGLSCVGNPTNLKCFKKKELGMSCGKDPFWVCEDGLSCVDDICKQVIVDQGGVCDVPNTVCGSGLECWDGICVY